MPRLAYFNCQDYIDMHLRPDEFDFESDTQAIGWIANRLGVAVDRVSLEQDDVMLDGKHKVGELEVLF